MQRTENKSGNDRLLISKENVWQVAKSSKYGKTASLIFYNTWNVSKGK